MDKKAIQNELNKVRAEIRELKSTFSKKKNVKEDFFLKGEDYSNKINALYEEVKQIEEKNNLKAINEELDSKKVEYETLKKEVELAEKNFNNVKKNSNFDFKKPVIKTVSVEKAKSELKKMEMKLQTQVLSLDKESQLLKKIAELKELSESNLGSFSNSSEGSDEFKDARKEFRKLKKKFINIERKIRSLYKQIRLISKEKKLKYKQIDEFRDLKKSSFEEFRKNKKDYSILGKDLKELFQKEDEILNQLGESPIQRKRESDQNIRIKQKEAEDKLMKKGGVLTTEDLLMFQKK